MKRSRAALVVVGLALAGCGNTTGSTASSSPSPQVAVAPSARPLPSDQASPAPGPTACKTADLEVAIGSESGAAGHIGLDFEVRNRSTVTCRLYGYFGLSLLTSEGKVGIRAQRSTRIFTASTGAPTALLLPPNSPPLPPGPATGVPAAVGGHGHFAAAYSDVCDNAASGTGNAWQLYPPEETVPMSVLAGAQAITVCSLQVTPVQANPPTP